MASFENMAVQRAYNAMDKIINGVATRTSAWVSWHNDSGYSTKNRQKLLP